MFGGPPHLAIVRIRDIKEYISKSNKDKQQIRTRKTNKDKTSNIPFQMKSEGNPMSGSKEGRIAQKSLLRRNERGSPV